jgi:hypothetical protein
MKWQTSVKQEQRIWALILIGAGVIGLLRVPGLITTWLIPGAENAPSFAKLNLQLMVVGGAALIAGAALAWFGWRRPRT